LKGRKAGGAASDAMSWPLLLGSATLAFVITFVATRWLIEGLRNTRMVGHDLHKPHRPLIPEMGGLAVIAGFYGGVTILQLFATEGPTPSYIHASLVAGIGAGFAGLLDDLFRLRRRAKAILPFLFAIPLGIVVFRDPQGGTILLGADVGALVLLAIPFGITCAANATNMLEGFNGLGAGLGIIMSIAMIGIALATGEFDALYIVLPLLGALVAFLYFNRYPAKVFPGDSMTLFVGAAIAAAAIVAHQKTLGALLFAPMILEFFLKARGRFRGENYGEPDSDGKLRYDGRIESITHAVMRKRPMKEWGVVAVVWALEGAVVVAVLAAIAIVP